MKTLILASILAIPAIAQPTIRPTIPTAPLRLNRVGEIPIHLEATSQPGITAAYFELTAPGASFEGQNSELNGVKDLYCSESPIGLNKCILIGLNWTILPFDPPGTSATKIATFRIKPSKIGPLTVTIAGQDASDASGNHVVVGASSSATFNVSALSDLNGDGKIDLIDLQILVDQAFGRAACGTADLDQNGKCDFSDALELVKEALAP